MNLTDMLAALKARWRLELLLFVAVLLAAALWSLLSPRTYEATATLLFDQRAPDATLKGENGQEDNALMLGTQADIIRSDAVASAVAERTGLAREPGVEARWREATGGTGTVEGWLGRSLLSHLVVGMNRNTNVLTLSYRTDDPEKAARFANAFADTYVAMRLQMSTDPAKAYAHWFEERTREVRGRLEQAQNALATFQRTHGIIDSGDIDAEANRLSTLTAELAGAEASAADANARASNRVANSPDVQSSPVIQQLRTQIAAKTALLDQLTATYGDNYPDVVAARAELAALNNKLDSEVAKTAQSVRTASAAASSKRASLSGLVNAQRGRMLALSRDKSQLEVLQGDVDSARAAFDAVTQRLNAMRLQSELPSTDVRQLDQANPPLLPAEPNIPLRMTLGAILGVMLAISAAIALEWWRPRVRTRAGLAIASDVPVLGLISFDPSARKLLK